LALNEKESLLLRSRAVSSMLHLPSQESEAALLGLAEGSSFPTLLRRKSIRVLALSYQNKHLPLISNIFRQSSKDRLLRESCARALGEIGPGARSIRKELALEEPSLRVRELLKAKQIR